MDLGLDGKVAWVTGGSSGIGRASALGLCAEGARVAISARSEEKLRAAAREIADETGGQCIGVPLDVADASKLPSAHARVEEELGPVDVLVANGGGPPPGAFDDLTEEDLHTAVELNTASMWRLAKAVTPAMEERGSGCLVFVVSVSVKEPIPGLLLSNMTRPAVVGMAKTLAGELGPRGIRVLCVAPERIDTPRSRALAEARARASAKTAEEVARAAEARVPLRRAGRPEEVGDVVTWLASERASYLTGITVAVDGGSLAGLLS